MTNKQRKDVIALYNTGHTYRQIAERFGVNRSTIASIIKNYKAKH